MKKLIILLSSISLFAPSTTMLVSCSKAKNPKKEVKNDVKFEKSDYTVMVGGTVSVNVANFADLEKAGYTKNCSVIIDNPAIAKNVVLDTKDNTANKNYQTLQISGIGAGTTKVTVKFTNLTTIDVKEGSFNITVKDFSQYKVTWDTDKKTIKPTDQKIKVGNLQNYQEFVDMNYKNFTINMKSNDDGATDINLLLNGCEIEKNGDIYLNVYYPQLPPLGKEQKEYTLGTVTFTLLNTSANYTSNTGDISFNPFGGVKSFTIAKDPNKDINLEESAGYNFTITFKDDIPAIGDIQKNDAKTNITFSGSRDANFSATSSYSPGSDGKSFTLTLKFKTPSISYASGNITIDIRFKSGVYVYYANQSFKYSANRVSPGDKYDKPSDDVTAYTSKYPSSTNHAFSDWQTEKPAAQSIAITTAANLDAITKAGYKYKDTLTIAGGSSADDKDYYTWKDLNGLDLSKSENAKIFKGLDSKTSFSKIKAFSINNISVGTDNNLTLNINKLTEQVTEGTIHFVSRFYDEVGNVCCATAVFNYSASTPIASDVKFTRGSIPYAGQDGPTNQGDTLSNSIHLTDDDLSFDSFIVSATDDPNKLADATISSDKTDILAVENKLENKDGVYHIKMKLIGQQGKDVEQGKVTLTLISGGKSLTLDIYYGTYVGKDASSGNYAISNTETSGSVNYFVSKNASNRSVDVNYITDYNIDSAPNLEFADGYNYSGSESPFKYHDTQNMVGSVTFDGDIDVTGRGVISVAWGNRVIGNILFKGAVNYTANNDNSSEACGVISEQYGDFAANAARISENKEIHFMKDIQIYATTNIGTGIGFINTITTGIIGQVNVEGGITVSSFDSNTLNLPAGIIFSKSSSSENPLGFDNLEGLEIKNRVLINDYSSHFDLNNTAIICNYDEFYSPHATIKFDDSVGVVSGIFSPPGFLISSVSNTSESSKIFAINNVDINYFNTNRYNNVDIVKLQTGAGSISSFTFKIGDKSKTFSPSRYSSLATFNLAEWN
ncbi:hypothetical protein [Spiroplasma endosymbiont of Aspidapion aeneum]|uniref:hypothetical protein n=1 Tax=Spiroplasma endosymbiont of Aspidapion aeneum TaxID=3066276 RepID=UPI00313CB646